MRGPAAASRRRHAGSPRRRGSLAFLLVLSVACQAYSPGFGSEEWPTPTRGAVASEHPLATQAALAVLDAGGNAADAAVCAALVLAVVYPQAGNLGGGGFALWVPHAGGEAEAIDFREVAPARLRPDAYVRNGVPDSALASAGHLAVGVPGTPAGLWALHERYGRRPFAELVQPAIRLARDGFPIDAWLALHLRREGERERLMRNRTASAAFYPGGRPLREGEPFVQAGLAEALERYARQGPRGFYDGPVAEALVDDMAFNGGLLSRADLAGYEVRWFNPLVGWFRGMEVLTMPPPSAGGIALLQVLAVLDGFPLDERRSGPSTDRWGVDERAVHWWIEALRLAFADRHGHVADPDFHDVPLEHLLSSETISARRVGIGDGAAVGAEPLELPSGSPGGTGAGGETTHISVLDDEGNAVSMTVTQNGFFGSGVMVPEFGILLNNEMADFLTGGPANVIEPGKRPLSSMTPTVLREGGETVAMVVGSPGGQRIISAVTTVVLRKLVYEEPLGTAIDAPRLHQGWRPSYTEFESGWDPEVLARLSERGQEVRTMEPSSSSVQAIWVERGGEPVAYSDRRRGGVAGVQGRSVQRQARPFEFDTSEAGLARQVQEAVGAP